MTNYETINTYISRELFQDNIFQYDGSILGNSKIFSVEEFPDTFLMETLSMSKQIETILSGESSIYRGMCHQVSATILRKLFESTMISGGKIYTGVSKDIRYKNHSLLFVELADKTKGVIDLALDVDTIIPLDNQWHSSRLLSSARSYKAFLNPGTGELEFTIHIHENNKYLNYSMQETSDNLYKKSLGYSLALSKKGMVRSTRKETPEGFHLGIEFIQDFPDTINRLLGGEKALEIQYNTIF